MGRKRYTAEQITDMLREAEVLQCQDSTISEVNRKLGIAEQTYYRGRKGYGGMRIDQANGLIELDLPIMSSQTMRISFWCSHQIPHKFPPFSSADILE